MDVEGVGGEPLYGFYKMAEETILMVMQYLRAIDLASLSEVDKTIFCSQRVSRAIIFQITNIYPIQSPFSPHLPPKNPSPGNSSQLSSSPSVPASSFLLPQGVEYRPANLYIREIKCILSALNSQQPLSGKGYWISTTWLANSKKYYEALTLPNIDVMGSMRQRTPNKKQTKIRQRRGSDSLPPWPSMTADIICQHGCLSLGKGPGGGKRRLVDPKSFFFLRKFYPAGPIFKSTKVQDCELCTTGLELSKATAAEKREAELSQRRAATIFGPLENVAARRCGVPSHLLSAKLTAQLLEEASQRLALTTNKDEDTPVKGKVSSTPPLPTPSPSTSSSSPIPLAGGGIASMKGGSTGSNINDATMSTPSLQRTSRNNSNSDLFNNVFGSGVSSSASSSLDSTSYLEEIFAYRSSYGISHPQLQAYHQQQHQSQHQVHGVSSFNEDSNLKSSSSFSISSSASSSLSHGHVSALTTSLSSHTSPPSLQMRQRSGSELTDDEPPTPSSSSYVSSPPPHTTSESFSEGTLDMQNTTQHLEEEYRFAIEHCLQSSGQPLIPGLYNLVPKRWLKAWRSYIKDPSVKALPILDCTSLLCHAHGHLVVPPHVEDYLVGLKKSLVGGLGTYPGDVYEILSAEEWDALQSSLSHSMADFSVRFCLDGEGGTTWSVPVCSRCDPFDRQPRPYRPRVPSFQSFTPPLSLT